MTIAQITKIFSNMGFVAISTDDRTAITLHSRKVNKMEVENAADQAGIGDSVRVDRDRHDNVCVYPK